MATKRRVVKISLHLGMMTHFISKKLLLKFGFVSERLGFSFFHFFSTNNSLVPDRIATGILCTKIVYKAL